MDKELIKEEEKSSTWINIQKKTKRGYNIISPPLNINVHKVCMPSLIKKTIIWLGGPPHSGKTTIARRLQSYGFMSLDAEDPWCEAGKKRLYCLKKITNKVYNNLNTSFVFAAAYENFLLDAPNYVIPILLLPYYDAYVQFWKKYDPKQSQGQDNRWKISKKLSENKKLITIQRDYKEPVDFTIIKIFEQINNTYN